MYVESGVSDVKLISNLDPVPGKMELRPFRHWKKIMIILSLSSVLMCLCVYSVGKLQVCCDSSAEEVEKDGRKADFHQVAKSVYHHRKQLWDERDTDDYDYSESDGDEFLENGVYQGNSALKSDGSLHDDYVFETTETSKNSNAIKYSHHIEKGTKKLPNAIIIGVKKGGTRALLEYIRLHPDVRGVGPETHFFDRNYDRGLEWYRQQMPSTLDGQLTIEKTPSYFITKEVPRRLHRVVPSAKLLLVVRDPVTRALSDYAQTVSKRHGIKSFEQLAFVNYNSTNTFVDSKWSAVKIGIYAKHLERWLQHFPLEQICFISGENLIRDPAAEIRKVQDFLGLKRIITEKHFYFNETKGFPCLMKAEGNSNPHCLGKTKGRAHPKLDNSALLRLQDFYRPYNMKFYQMTGINFGWP